MIEADAVAACTGKTPVRVSMISGNEEASIVFSDQSRLRLFHVNDCCESFALEEVYGDPEDLLFVPLALSELVTTRPPGAPEPSAEGEDSFTDTWVKFRTIKGDVTLRFRGSSNGYYSEACYVDLGRAVLSDADQVAFDALVERNLP